MKIGLVGATNTGKSTLFNRLIGQFRAIVTDIPGTTIDILEHKTKIDGLGDTTFFDSPGLHDFAVERDFICKIIDGSDLILFVIDDNTGISAKEQNIANYIRAQNKQSNTILVINKLDIKWKESQLSLALSDYYGLGFDNMVGISAKTGRNIEDIKELIIKLNSKLKRSGKIAKSISIKPSKQDDSIPIAILGKPNVGKSTLLNTLTGKYLSKVENNPGTTRDYVVGDFLYLDNKYTLYDTAGIKKRGHMKTLEKIAYQKTIDMIKFIRPIVFFVIDAKEEITHRDKTLLEEINNIGLPIIILLNKTDLLTPKQTEHITLKTQAHLDFAKYIPIIPIIAKTGKGTANMLKMANIVHKEIRKQIETSTLNKIISKEFISRPPRFPHNRICKIFYITQINIDAPTFMVFINHKDRANFAFKKRIDNSLRKHFGFIGSPIVIRFKERSEKEDSKISQNSYGSSNSKDKNNSKDKDKNKKTISRTKKSKSKI